jgi:hypothetical protein
MPASIGFGVRAQLGPGSRLQDDLLLAPLLRNRDLLSLSATATWLRPYRNQLGGVKIRAWRDGVTPAMLAGQRRLHTIEVAGAKVLRGLTTSLRGEEGASTGVTLRRLILGWWMGTPDLADGLRELGVLLAEGGCPALEELRASCIPLGTTGASALARGLGGCPELRRLTTQCNRLEEFEPFLAALERGVCPHLQSLHTSVTFEGARAEGNTLARALQAYPRPVLQELVLNDVPVGSRFGDALRSKACRGLRVLCLNLASFEEGVAVTLGEALGEGACLNLSVLALERNGLGPQGARALAQAMGAGQLARLETLRVSNDRLLDEGVVALAEALRQGACPRLRELELTCVGMGKEGCRALARIVREGGLPSLKRINVYGNRLGGDSPVALVEAVEERGGNSLILVVSL